MKILRRFVLAACAALPATIPAIAQGQELQLLFDRVTIRTELPASGTPSAKIARADTTIGTVRLGLGGSYFWLDDSLQYSAFDFARRQVHLLDRRRSTARVHPLIATAAYRDMELQNRLALRRTMEVVGRGEQLAWLECVFGMTVQGQKRERDDRVVAGSSRTAQWHLIGADTASSIEFSDRSFTAAQAPMFEKFLLYSCQLHPAARVAAMAPARVPRVIRYRVVSLGDTTDVRLVLRDVQDRPGTTYELPAQLAALGTWAPFDSALAAAMEATRSGTAGCGARAGAWRENALAHAADALERGQALEALLACDEIAMTGSADAPDELLKKIRKRSADDPRLGKFVTAVEKIEKRRPADALKLLQGIERTGLPTAHVLDVEIAAARRMSGDSDGARDGFLAAVRANPCLTGAWVDAGSTFLSNYDPYDAWICYEMARVVAPAGCRLLQSTDALEQRLMREHPEYF